MPAAPLLALLLAAAPDTLLLERGIHDPAVAPDGRVVFAAQGDLWLAPAAGAAPTRLTRDEAWDRGPAWAPDGSVVFASDRGGARALWRVPPGAAPERLTAGAATDSEPAAAADGAVVFVRGEGAEADLWIRATDGAERRLTTGLGPELSPAVSPDGRRIAYVEERLGRRRLRVHSLDGGADRTLAPDHPAERPAWSPDGERIAFVTRGARPGVWVADAGGAWVNQLSQRAAEPAWEPGGTLLLADLPREDAGYNGDPDRLGDRDAREAFPRWGRLWRLTPAPTPDASLVDLAVRLPVDGDEHAGRVFERVWGWLDRQYGADAGQRAAFLATRDRHRAAALAAGSLGALEAAIHRLTRERPAFRAEATGRAAVSSAHPLASAAGAEILRRGGNVVDAAVAVSFMLGVVEPDASGIGGYGTMLVQLRGMERPTAIEFLTRVPQDATLENGSIPEAGDGPAVVNVPGTVAGMWHAWKRYGSGRIRWAELVLPAAERAEQGWVLDEGFATTLRVERERYARHPTARALLFRGDQPLQAGDTLRNPDLGWTLRQVAEGGVDAFYKGEIARRLVADLHGRGNAMQLTDLSRYHPVEREPVVGTYRGHTVYSSPPATSGGALLIAKLNLLERARLAGAYPEDAAAAHAMIEAWKLIPSTRGRVADPGLWPVELEPFVSKDTAAARWRCFAPDRALAPAAEDSVPCPAEQRSAAGWGSDGVLDCGPDDQPARGRGCRMTGTTSFAVGDGEGNLVSVTQTLGTWGGSFYVTPGLGFLYNDKLRSYGDDRDAYNARIPFARNVTSISPTLVFRGTGDRQRPWLALGAAGNAWINSAVYQMIVGAVDDGLGPQRALELPRFLVGSERLPGGERRSVVQVENGLDPAVERRLLDLGHELHPISREGELRMGYGAIVEVVRAGVRAGADPRRSGAAVGVKDR